MLVTWVIIVGIALGIGTKLADNQENALTWLGSLTAPWIIVSFGFGAVSVNWIRSALSAAGAMLTGILAYYSWMWLFEGGVNLSYFLSVTVLWVAAAPVVGIVFGLCGWMWRHGDRHWLMGSVAVALAGGIIAGESAFMAFSSATLSSAEVTILCIWITVGLMMPLVLLSQRRDRLAGLGLTLCWLMIGLATVPLFLGFFAATETAGGLR
ncbi:MAG: hypothetical protein EA415_10115 [Sphaerobacteraceae bacterium]|nr:MAG: hypothetical protein EA415_10115 [Sphaerobacteraceae bacterium]